MYIYLPFVRVTFIHFSWPDTYRIATIFVPKYDVHRGRNDRYDDRFPCPVQRKVIYEKYYETKKNDYLRKISCQTRNIYAQKPLRRVNLHLLLGIVVCYTWHIMGE